MADLHCHSTASERSKLGVQRSVGMPECATPPEEVYELAKRRGMDFVTITDHDTIDGALSIADRPDVFISEELTANFRGEPQAVHVLCLGITPEDHEWLQANRGDVELCAQYMRERDIVCALAHPYYQVAAPLMRRHRRRLAELFPIWEVRNGARPAELNRPAATYIETLDGVGIAGSDDHAGVDIGRTFTETPYASNPAEFLDQIRAGNTRACGDQGSAAKWAHAAIAIAARSLGVGTGSSDPDPLRVMQMARRVLAEGDAREGQSTLDLSPEDARTLLRAWLAAVGLDGFDEKQLIAMMQSDDFSHAALLRRACRAHERGLRSAVEGAVGSLGQGAPALLGAAQDVFRACTAVIPYAPASAFLADEQRKLAKPAVAREPGEPLRVALMADGIGSTHGVSRAIAQIRERAIDGCEVEVVGTDPAVDRRLAAACEIDLPFYDGLRIGVPSLPASVAAVADGHFDVVHVTAPGPAGIAGVLIAKALGLPLVGSYHTELAEYALLRSGDEKLAQTVQLAVAAFYSSCDVLLSPSPASDEQLRAIGVPADRILRWDRGVDTSRFDPSLRDGSLFPGELNVLYAGRITREKGVELLAQAFLEARTRDERLHLLIAGGGPEQERLAALLGPHATFLGWLDGEELAKAYASADLFLFPSATDTFGQVILEAQASGLPVVAVAAGGPLSLIEDRVSGRLCPPDSVALADAMLELLQSPLLRGRVVAAGLRAARARTWEAAMARLADGYRLAMDVKDGGSGRRAA